MSCDPNRTSMKPAETHGTDGGAPAPTQRDTGLRR